MLKRSFLHLNIEKALKRSRIVGLLGPRQCGKTTLAREFTPLQSLNYFDLEDPLSLSQLKDPMTTLRNLKGTVVIDEIQRKPDLFPILRVLADRRPLPARFLILGSASPELLRQSSESLAGRLEIIPVSGFSLTEVGITQQSRHWLRGGFPLSFLAKTENDSLAWRKNFIQLVLERDLPLLGINIPSATLLRFWAMLAHYHAQIWNAAEPARSLGISESSVRHYLDLLTGIFMIRQLKPWHANLNKRQVKSPKIYFRDTGLLHSLLNIPRRENLLRHPKLGASWEGYVIEEVIKHIQPDETYFWATHNGAELDLLLIKNGKRLGIECKFSDAPRLTPSIKTALQDLNLEKIIVLYPGEKAYSLSQNVNVIPFLDFFQTKLF